MNKFFKTKTLGIAIITGILISGITVFAASQHKQIFKDVNGDEVVVLTNSQQEFLDKKGAITSTSPPESEKVEVGQTIVVDGEEVIVFAVGDDGSYITVTPQIFYEFEKSGS